uniref:Homeobox B5b n=1 Tax=Labrus bergylta TaxID=56723 RepID=A0A3Q3EZ72_9LABR
MSSYFVNSFSGRYPNGSDYQLLNYGTNGAVNGSFRDPGTMHSGSFGYNYNGMDLTVNRTNTGSHFPAVREDARGFGQDARYRQTPNNCSLSSSQDPVPQPPPSCATASREPLELKSPSPPSDRSATSGGNNLNKNTSDPNATSSTPSSNDCQSPQIFPWMRKLHISHVFSKSPLKTHSRFFFKRKKSLKTSGGLYVSQTFSTDS